MIKRNTPKYKEYREYLIKKFNENFQKRDQKTYRGFDGETFRLDYISEFNSFVLEFAINEKDYRNNCFEDGELYSITDYSPEQIYIKMMEEIKTQ